MKEIDYLSEDPKIPGVKYALVSIIGPHVSQKCDVWGLKIRGYSSDQEKGRKMIKRLMTIDDTCDIYLVEVGKFFPLAVDPLAVDDIEYQTKELNDLMRNYLENRAEANTEFNNRKNELMKEAIKEGKKNRENTNLERIEHPVAILKRKRDLVDKLQSLKEQIVDCEQSIKITNEKYDNYTDKEKLDAEETLLKVIENNEFEGIYPESKETTAEEIRDQILKDLKEPEPEPEPEQNIIELIQNELQQLELKKENNDISQSLYKQEKERLLKKIQKQSSENVNQFIDKNWIGSSKYNF